MSPDESGTEVSADTSLSTLIADAAPGDEIVIPAGEYALADLKIRKDLSLRGNGEVIFKAAGPVAKGILNPMPGVSIRVENITFRGATSPDKNGAGIRHDGKDLTIINCRFERNENGVLATGAEDSIIKISQSAFVENGHGDGYSHGIYVVRAASLTVEESTYEGTRIGHHIKSLAGRRRR